MKAGALKFFVIYFQILKTDLGTHSSYLCTARIFEIPEIAEMSYLCTWSNHLKTIFGFPKIAEEKVMCLSFQNNLVARYHIQN